jgi:hypothetical protein
MKNNMFLSWLFIDLPLLYFIKFFLPLIIKNFQAEAAFGFVDQKICECYFLKSYPHIG